MAAKCCGGDFDVFLQRHIHTRDCPTRTGNQDSARERFERERRVKHVVDNVFGFPVGGNRRRNRRLL